MPCISDWPDHRSERLSKTEADLAEREAMLCEAMRFIESSGDLAVFSDDFNEKRAGVLFKDMLKWWKEHQRKDAIREAAEAATREQEQLRKSAIAKLTDKEIAALGLNFVYPKKTAKKKAKVKA